MKKYILPLLFPLIFLSCGRENPAGPDDHNNNSNPELSGKLSGTLIAGAYHVIGNIYVDSLETLTLEPGCRLFFISTSRLIIKGEFSAEGSREKPVLFTAYNDSAWGGIKISGSISSEFKFCIIENAVIDKIDTAGNGAVESTGSNIKIINSIIRNNRVQNGGGLWISRSAGNISNNIFHGNYSAFFGGGILAEGSSIKIINNTFFKNSSGNHGGGIVLINNSASSVQNNIFHKNSGRTGNPAISIIQEGNGIIDTAYNFFGRENLDPGFISDNDFHLRPWSPCINGGNPDSLCYDFNGSRNDQGAYGGILGDW